MLQSDHGPEFGKYFVDRIKKDHRFTRIGKPNDNSHIERFNRTLQEECLDKLPVDVSKINCELRKYLQYYNYERLHMGINLKTPNQFINNPVQAIG
jgi:transposase InsO family protein